MNTSNDNRLEELEEVVQHTVNKVKELENRKVELPEIRLPNYTRLLEAIETELKRVQHSYPVDRIDKQVKDFKTLVDKIPDRIQYQHRHYFQDGSKGYIVGMIGMILLTVLSVGLMVTSWIDNRKMTDNSVKFRMIRQYYPVAARWANKEYHRNPEMATKNVDRLEAKQEADNEGKSTAAERELK
ncbi:hypothetical protein [Hufsiella ginkgonis]|uniref:Uncharacterized protein n=1 Tax=Hufsiella ginkgonis TaxID=2695274 RepID=A0A7K1XZZ8_9SPHI|nr:hypothetical protein [Hufsiella ginkgonis]MXV16540.1 hypothetical protein [Hufsiella ginkgonis]